MDAWPSIEQHGLLSTSAALDLHGVEYPARAAIERARRPETVRLDHAEYGCFVIRDQKPINEIALARSLTGGLAPADWYALLNGRVFLWAQARRLERMLKTYRRQANLVLVLDSAALLEAYLDQIEVSCINTGALFTPNPAPRARDSFRPLAAVPTSEFRNIAEVTVPAAIPDVRRFILDRKHHVQV